MAGFFPLPGAVRMLQWIALTLALLTGCGCSAWPSQPGRTLVLNETDDAGQPVRQLSLELTDEPAQTCRGGDWKKVVAVRDPAAYTANPAYTLAQGKLEILLVNQVCDAYDSYVGELADGRFTGKHVAYGMRFNKTLGDVSGRYTGD